MLEWTALLLQAATTPEAAPPARTSVLPAPCPTQPSGDIVVCGRPDAQESYRLRAVPERFVKDPQFRITLPGGSTITPHADQGRMGDLQAKVTLKVPF
jgi:hypothetical protein